MLSGVVGSVAYRKLHCRFLRRAKASRYEQMKDRGEAGRSSEAGYEIGRLILAPIVWFLFFFVFIFPLLLLFSSSLGIFTDIVPKLFHQ